MKRGGGLKRTGPPKRKKSLPKQYRPTRAAKTASQIDATNRFKDEARSQRVCAVCGDATRHFDAHHVIEAQYLRQNHHPVYVRPNALRLCNRFSKNDCHGKHTRGSRKVRLKELTDDNIDYAFALLGVKAYNYLRRHYKGTDPRVEEAMKEITDGDT